MFSTQHYRAIAEILHQSRNKAIEFEASSFAAEKTYQFWYDHVYTPFVKLFEQDNEKFDAPTFSYAVATGKIQTGRLKG